MFNLRKWIMGHRTRRSKRWVLLTAIGAACVAILGAVIEASGIAGDVVSVVDGLCERASFFHRVPFLCPDRMELQVLCTNPNDQTDAPPCVSFYVTNPMTGLDFVGGQFEVLDVSVSPRGSPLGQNAKEATYHAEVTDNHLVVGERIPFHVLGPLSGSGENVNIQVCPYYTNPTQQVTLTLRPQLYSPRNEPTSLDVESFEIKLKLAGIANPSVIVKPSEAGSRLAAPPGVRSTLDEHGCEVSRR